MSTVERPERVADGAVLCPQRVPGAELRVFLLHHAGGSHLLFRGWWEHFPANWEVCFVETPGHGRLAGQDPLGDAGSVASFVLEDLARWTDRPYVVFGHSMGALLTFELGRRLLGGDLRRPSWLGLSACGAPLPSGRLEVPLRHLMPDDELRAAVARIGGTPPEVLEEEDYWQLFEPLLRKDFELVETWRNDLEAGPLPVPLSVFGGSRDTVASPERLAAWSQHTERFLGLHVFPGAHFYFQECLPRFITTLVTDVKAALTYDEAAVPR